MADKVRVAVLISGRGSNMAALIYAARADDCPYEVALVSGDKPDAPGLDLAQAERVDVLRLDGKKLGPSYWEGLQVSLGDARIDVVALAGFMRIIPASFVERWAGKIINIHPSLLPRHRGLHSHDEVLAAGERVTGCTVHEVTADLDDGPILGQVEVAVLPGDDAQSLATRVLIAEHQLYPRILAEFVARDTHPEALLDQVRALALALPEAAEKVSHGSPGFFVKGGKFFAYFSANHHGDGRIALLVKISGVDEQMMLIEGDAERYFRPAYFGDSWIGIRLDLTGTDWAHIDEWLTRSWRTAAPKRLAAMPI
ncbi:MAG: phosphoribosylglycinamide formyltransferase [Sphingomonas bacterium]|nr:phosphoribosylglycinamide formyltransferase [Sphingomonas bacterium]